MALQAYIDDSYTRDGTLVLAGCMAAAETWARFSEAWEQTLPWGIRDERGFYFHMAGMAVTPERMERVGAFWRVIEEHKPLLVCAKINISELRNAIGRIWSLNKRINHGLFAQPHCMAFIALVEGLLKQRSEIPLVEQNERIDFILHQHSQDKFMIRFWSDFTKTKPDEVKMDIGKLPRFESDREFLPLQAADLVAWWLRRWHEDKRVSQDAFEPKFDGWKSLVPLDIILIEKNEDQIVDTLLAYILASPGGKDAILFDSRRVKPI